MATQNGTLASANTEWINDEANGAQPHIGHPAGGQF
jgi:hypothetical protein